MDLSDLKKTAGALATRLILVAGSALLIQLGAIYVVWDTLNNRMNDISGMQVEISDQVGKLREDSGYIRGQVDALDASRPVSADIEEIELEIAKRLLDVERSLGEMSNQLALAIDAARASSNISLNAVVPDIVDQMDEISEIHADIFTLQASYHSLLREVEILREDTIALIRVGANQAAIARLSEVLDDLDVLVSSAKSISSSLASSISAEEQ